MLVTLEMMTIFKSLYGTPGSFRGSKICAKSSYAYHHHHMLPKKMKRGKKGKMPSSSSSSECGSCKRQRGNSTFSSKKPSPFLFFYSQVLSSIRLTCRLCNLTCALCKYKSTKLCLVISSIKIINGNRLVFSCKYLSS